MAVIAAQGLQLSIASAFGSPFTISAITNASEGVATLSASHGVTVGDLIEITSGWKRLNQRVVRAKTVATNDVTLERVNTTSTTDYPAGEGVGTGREITTWTNISQLTPDISVSGGGFRVAEITQLDDVRVKEKPILAEAVTLTFNYFWDPALPWLSAVETAARSGQTYPFRIVAGAAKIYGNAYWGYSSEPSVQNFLMVSSIQLSAQADSITYTT
jgi:hypothetical protein